VKIHVAIAILLISAVSTRAFGDIFGSGINTFDIEFVTIDKPGNAADTTGAPNPAGSVSYVFQMGKFEISEQMIVKANELGGLGITQSDRGADMPSTLISWNEAARFVNWLNTSTGSAPAYKFAIQPGQVGYNANDNIQLWTVGDAGYNPNNRYRNSLAMYFLPSADEWYKAAYYDPTSGVYFNYPTASDTAPAAVASGAAAGTAVYNQPPDTGPADITLAGGLSSYGTMGQGGNVFEWGETAFNLLNSSGSSSRVGRGGDWDNVAGSMSSLSRNSVNPSNEGNNLGFRVASIPEPTSMTLCLAGLLILALRRGTNSKPLIR
jgi:hypothetical protein